MKSMDKIPKELKSAIQRTKLTSILLHFSSGPYILYQLDLVTGSVFSPEHVSGSFKNSLDQKHPLQKKKLRKGVTSQFSWDTHD